MGTLMRDGTAKPVSRDQFSGANADKEIFIFPVQLTTCRIGNLTRLIHTLAICVTIHTFIHAGAPIATCVFFFFPLVYLDMSLFPSIFCTELPFSNCMESTSYVLSFRMVFFYLVTTGWIFYISVCEKSI